MASIFVYILMMCQTSKLDYCNPIEKFERLPLRPQCTTHQTMYDESDEDDFITWFASYFIRFVSFFFIIFCKLRPYKVQTERIHWYTHIVHETLTTSVTVTFLVISCNWTEGKSYSCESNSQIIITSLYRFYATGMRPLRCDEQFMYVL